LSSENFSSNTLGSLNTNFKKNKSDQIESIKQEGEVVIGGGGGGATKLLLTNNETSLTKLSLNPTSQENTPSSLDISKKVNKYLLLESVWVLRIHPQNKSPALLSGVLGPFLRQNLKTSFKKFKGH